MREVGPPRPPCSVPGQRLGLKRGHMRTFSFPNDFLSLPRSASQKQQKKTRYAHVLGEVTCAAALDASGRLSGLSRPVLSCEGDGGRSGDTVPPQARAPQDRGKPELLGGLFSSLVSYDPYSVVWEHIRVSRLLLFPLELIFFKKKKEKKHLRN